MTHKKLKFKSIIARCITYFLLVSVVLLLVIGMIFPTLFYQMMKPYFNNNIEGLMSASATRVSYILGGKNGAVYTRFPNDSELQSCWRTIMTRSRRRGMTRSGGSLTGIMNSKATRIRRS